MFQQAIKPLLKIAAVAALAVLVPGTQSPAYAQVTPYLGQMMYAGFNFAPKGWAMCNGQLLAINQNQALFALIGTFYGGNGTTNFALPNMQGRAPIHQGSGGASTYTIGEAGGYQAVTLNTNTMPSHSHSLSLSAQIPASSGNASSSAPAGNGLANTVHDLSYSADAPNVSLGSSVSVSGNTGLTGSSVPIGILPPYLTVNCVIALSGVFPSQN